MVIPNLHSIADITPEDCIPTLGSRPVRVFCNDINYYICKYFRGEGAAYSLFNEYIASRLLQVWRIQTPRIAFVSVKTDHINQTGIPKYCFNIPCFGSFYHREFKDVDAFFSRMSFQSQEYDGLRESFLMIALFDIWISNEDRTENNFNLLYDAGKKLFVPIDHVTIFNGNNLDKEPEQITINESIINALLMRRLFSRTLPTNLTALRYTIITRFNEACKRSYESLPQLLHDVPTEWQLDKKYLVSRMSYLFSEEWINKSIETFNTYLQISLNHK